MVIPKSGKPLLFLIIWDVLHIVHYFIEIRLDYSASDYYLIHQGIHLFKKNNIKKKHSCF